MASNVAIKISADTVDVEAKFAVASARVREFNTELNKLAREASTTGVTDTLRQQMLQTSESLLGAKNQAAALSQELKRNAEPAMRDFSGATSLAREALGAFGIAFAAREAVTFIESTAEAGANLVKLSEQTGVSTETLSAWQYAAGQADVSAESLNTGILRLGRAVQESLITPTSTAALAFASLGISQEFLRDNSNNLEAILAKMADSFHDHAAGANADAVAQAVLGRAGAELIPFLQQGSAGLEAMRAKAEELGVVFSGSTAEAMKAHTVAVKDMTAAWSGLWHEISGPVYSTLTGVAHFLTSGIELVREYTGELRALAFAAASTDEVAPKAVSPAAAAKPAFPSFDKQAAGAKSGRDDTQRIADEQTQIWETASQKRIEGEQQANAALLALGNQSLEQFRDQAKRLEEARYETALGGLQARQQIDKGDAVALARDNAEMEVIAVDHANKLAEIDNKYEEDHLRAVKESTDKESALRQAAFNADFAARQEQARLEITQIQQTNTEIEAINRQEVAAKRAAMQEIGAVEGQLARGIISGRQSAGQIALQITQTLLEKELTADLAYLTEHEAVNLGILASDQATAQEGLLAKLAAWAAEKLGFTVAAAEKTTVAAAEYAAQVPMIIGLAGAGGVASMAAAPFPIDLTAPAFGASMAAAAAGFAVLDVGTDFVPRDMPALIHQGERVIPAADNRALISALNGGGGGNAMHMTNTFHISAGTPADVAGQLKKHLVGAINEAVRGGYLKLA